MYGCNKLYCEHLGRYYADHYKQLAAETLAGRIDFRCVRFPGLISAVTVPSGGTSDYAPEMLHAAAQGKPYACFVRPDTRIPFMAMPDAVEALLALAAAPRETLTAAVYNVGAFNPSAEEIRRRVLEAFPGASVAFQPAPQAASHRGLLAGGRGRLRGPARLGLRPALRRGQRLRRLPGADHPGAIPESLIRRRPPPGPDGSRSSRARSRSRRPPRARPAADDRPARAPRTSSPSRLQSRRRKYSWRE